MATSSAEGIMVGIDLGTTFSAVATLRADGRPMTIPNSEGMLTTPSVIYFENEDNIIVGGEAARVALVNPDRVAECVKRQMGEDSYDREIGGRRYRPEELSALILKKLKQDAEAQFGPIAGAVITVPAYFDFGRRKATKDAGEIAGLAVVDIVNEPTAAALAYGFREHVDAGRAFNVFTGLFSEQGKNILIYDLGGGTFDVTLMRLERDSLTILATGGEIQLGGKDWDERIVKFVAEKFLADHGMDPREDPYVRQALFTSAEEAKRSLSVRHQTTLNCSCGGKMSQLTLTREQFNELTLDLLTRTEMSIESLITDAKLGWNDVTSVQLVGGSTRMPQVVESLTRLTGRPPGRSLSADEVVAHGAAIHAAMWHVKQARLRETQGGQEAAAPPPGEPAPEQPQAPAPVGEPTPASAQPAETDKPQPARKPTKVVLDSEEEGLTDAAADVIPVLDWAASPDQAYGEEQADALDGLVVTNVNAHGLGMVAWSRQKKKGVNAIIIPKNTKIPHNRTKTFYTRQHNQGQVSVQVVEGDTENLQACSAITDPIRFVLPTNLPARSPVDVTFSYAANGMVKVRAVEKSSGANVEVEIIRKGGMTAEDIRKAAKVTGKRKVS